MLRGAFDVFVVWLVFQVRSWAWFKGDLGRDGFDDVPASWWEYGSAADLLLFGPDAGNWAANAQALMEGAEPCLLYTSPSPRDVEESRMPSSA